MIPRVSSVYRDGHEKVNWFELPDDIVNNIANRFTRQKDLIRFGTVCHSWQSIYTEVLQRHSPRLPLLMLATELNQDDQTRSLYSISDNTVCNSQVPVPQNRRCPGYSHGWVATVTPDLKVRLINIFNRNEIPLPPLEAFERDTDYSYYHPGFLSKIVLSTDPESDPNYVILAIHGATSCLAYYKPGDTVWTSLDFKYFAMDDAIFYKDQFYVVNYNGEVYAIDLDHTEPRISEIAPAPSDVKYQKRYLVESSGDLLQILRYTELGARGTVCADNSDDPSLSYHNDGFDVFKWDKPKWTDLQNLGDRMFFVGDNYSLCVSAATFPKCMPNSIYYTDDHHEGYHQKEEYGFGPHDMGVFSFDDGRNRPHYPTTSQIINPPPIWIEPPIDLVLQRK